RDQDIDLAQLLLRKTISGRSSIARTTMRSRSLLIPTTSSATFTRRPAAQRWGGSDYDSSSFPRRRESRPWARRNYGTAPIFLSMVCKYEPYTTEGWG
ncbi:MAG TPA: hypothetical protein VEF33_06215, partial [Syntrophales bacterium]|nr:hypothetical protein [Syntrophales bacterium]